MPNKDPIKYNEYMKKYVLERHRKRMAQAIALLGGKCARCGSIQDLDIDHIDPATKAFSISKKAAGVSEEKFQAELRKCQLLCRACHNDKSIRERGQLPRGERHGTLTKANTCKCDLCRAAKAAHNKAYKAKRKLQAQTP